MLAVLRYSERRFRTVPIAFGTVANYGFCLVGRPVAELTTMQRAGMSPVACLQAATSNAADLLGCKDRGTIERGKRADLVIVDRDIQDDMAAIERVQSVIVSGQLLKESPAGEDLQGVKTGAAVLRGILRTLWWSLFK